MSKDGRVCTQCKKPKPWSDFSVDCSQRTGYKAKCKECINKNTKGSRRPVHLMHRYGLTEADFDRLLEQQGNVCGLCRNVSKLYYVDHCHMSGIIRGILCPSCNTGLGHLQESPELLRRAADYLEGK